MNILFLTESDLSPMQGGTEHITLALAEGLQRKNCKCYLAYGIDCKMTPAGSFAGKMKYVRETAAERMASYVRDNDINIVVSNLVNIDYKRWLLPLTYSICQELGVKMIACYHAMPGEELRGNTFYFSLYKLFHGGRPGQVLKDMMLGLMPQSFVRLAFRRYIRGRYRLMYDNCDRLVLLSSRFFREFADLGELKVDDKFASIPNALTYDEFLQDEDIPKKKQEVMILCRMDEKSKRLSRALKIWKRVEAHNAVPDWNLTIVGGGPDLQFFKDLASRLHLKRVSFEGRQEDAIQYYRRSSIFMMTSAYEGWGLTLTESLQMGVVPMAFNSYSSLPEIIVDGINGFIIPDGRLDLYADKLEYLMEHNAERKIIASEAIRSSHRFELARVCDLWLTFFNSL